VCTVDRDIPTHTVLGAPRTKQWSKNDPHPTEAHTDVVTNLLHLPELGLLASTSLDHTIKVYRMYVLATAIVCTLSNSPHVYSVCIKCIKCLYSMRSYKCANRCMF
jgi:hypothetical protein